MPVNNNEADGLSAEMLIAAAGISTVYIPDDAGALSAQPQNPKAGI